MGLAHAPQVFANHMSRTIQYVDDWVTADLIEIALADAFTQRLAIAVDPTTNYVETHVIDTDSEFIYEPSDTYTSNPETTPEH